MKTKNIDALLDRAKSCGNTGDITGAIQALKTILDIDSEHTETLAMLGQAYSSISEFENAALYFQKATTQMSDTPWIWYDYGQALEHTNRHLHAAAAYLKAWKIDPNNVRFPLFAGSALHKAGRPEHALHIWSLGADQDPMLRTAHQNPNADSRTQQKSRHADQELRTFLTALHQKSLTKSGMPERLRTSLWPQTHIENVKYETEALKPYIFYAPDLPPIPVFETSDAVWVDELQSATPTIRAEYLAFMRHQHGTTQSVQRPYIEARSTLDSAYDHLKGQDTWTALHLYKDGKAQPCLNHFPQTQAALENVPLVYFHGQPMEVFFSILKPGVHIPPHFGLANTRLTSHLPLIIPKETCRIRVADQVHHWREGELFLFDDSFNHEAWNESEDTRVVLIFESWRPDLEAQEIKAIQTSFEDRDTWLKSRQIPELEL